ncbi:PIN domain-containing protein [Pigmentiphaga soli]|uniref:PIN domain-containing protein n=1 Tax=Pigmentiphaga soli TaxID=1007095 RepID=A0ABP8GHT3_9BURK
MVLYLLSADAGKADGAEALLWQGAVISVQVLNEVASVCTRKLGMRWDDVGQFLELVRSFCKVVPLTVDVHDCARRFAQRHGMSFYDACIAAAAAVEGCRTLYSEGLHHGLVIDGALTVRNPFAAPGR